MFTRESLSLWATTWTLGALLAFGSPSFAETVTVKGTTKAFKYNGASGSISFSVAGGAPKGAYVVTASSDKDWIVIDPLSASQTVTLGSKGTANKSVRYRVSPYTSYSPTPRSGVITIDKDKYFTVTQTGVACKVAITPTSSSYPAEGDNGLFSVTAPDGCGWTAYIDGMAESWIGIEGYDVGEGAGSVAFTVASNDATKSRTGKIYVTPDVANPSKKTYSVRQAKFVPAGTAEKPTFDPPAGTYAGAQTVTIATSTAGAQFRYTTDGSTPSATVGTLIAAASGEVTVGTSETLKAVAFKTGWTTSGVATAAYTITGPAATYTDPVTGMEFVWVPAGTFQMGDVFGDGESNEQPVHTVTLTSGFYLGKTEVTQAQWQAVMGSNPSYYQPSNGYPSCPTCPVEQVSWNDVQSFRATLNVRTGNAYRLPTEAEWEYAASYGPPKKRYAGTSLDAEMGDYMWWGGGGTPHPVGEKLPNSLGLYDMSGNVVEWVQDWYGDSYEAGPATDPTGPATGSYRVVRGGSWTEDAELVRVSIRDPSWLGAHSSDRGFRLALSP